MDARQSLTEPVLAGGIETGGGLVEKQEARTGQQCARNRQALAHPAREIAHGIVAAREQARRLERGEGAFLGAIQAVELGEKLEVLLGRQFVVQQNVVGDHADALFHGKRIFEGVRGSRLREGHTASSRAHEKRRNL